MKHTLWVTAGVAVSSCLISLEAQAASFTGLNVFGDSLADAGNLFNLTDTLLSPFGLPALPPSPPYAQNNSNGPIWIDNVGQALGLTPTLATELLINPTTPPPTQGVNFAFAGALSSDRHVLDDDFPEIAGLFPGFQDQVNTFTALSATLPVDPNALNVVWIGGNDYNEAFFNPPSLGRLTLGELPNVVTDNIITGLTQLSSLGAKEFLVVNLPSIGNAPFAGFLDALTPADIPTLLNQLIAGHNDLLSTKLTAFGQAQPDANILTLDVNTLFSDLFSNPSSFGLTNVTDACLTNFQAGFMFDGVCDNPDEFLFWDDTHPTTATHGIIGDLALATLNGDNSPPATAVPEPSSLITLLAMGAGSLLAKQRFTQYSGE